ncbi:MAG TPA: hypothetical protein VF786_00800, partial [Terriglobales bacterium]
MGLGEKERSVENPEQLYRRHLDELKSAQVLDEAAEKRLGYAKLVVAFCTVAAAVVLLWFTKFLALLLLPAGVFVYLAIRHERRLQRIRDRRRSMVFYERGLARIQDHWSGTGETGERFLDPAHPYARDLDIFGPASVFELFCTARTRAGEETLARWLLNAAPIDELTARHGAVADLKCRTDLREQLFCIGETVRTGVHPDALANWGERKPILSSRAIRVTSTVLSL